MAELLKARTNLDAALEALEFAEGAIIDAIAHEDGLDGATGYAVLQMIWPQLKKHGLTVATTNELASWFHAQYSVVGPLKPVSMRNRELEAEIERLQAIFAGMATVIREQELPDGDGLDVTVPVMMWLEGVVKSAEKARETQ